MQTTCRPLRPPTLASRGVEWMLQKARASQELHSGWSREAHLYKHRRTTPAAWLGPMGAWRAERRVTLAAGARMPIRLPTVKMPVEVEAPMGALVVSVAIHGTRI